MKLNQTITSNSAKTTSNSDKCARCQGFLVHVDFMDMLQGGFLWGDGMRCVNCGWIVDRVIHTNQRTHDTVCKPQRRKSRQTRKTIAA